MQDTAEQSAGPGASEDQLRRKIEEYYLPRQLVEAIFELGAIPETSTETIIGIGFLDIADYSFISKFLSPTENQVVLNGLFTAFNWVLRRHGGYLNKIEGDSLMFHFGGLTDSRARRMEPGEASRYIAREIFYACVEMQRVCGLFNQANDRFLDQDADPEMRADLLRAFEIIRTLRTSTDVGNSMNALFQIRIRIGANIGEVTMGNLGPRGRKTWDVIGVPVIEAKRMEATAPIGGLRITQHLYDALVAAGIVDAYYERFRREAGAMAGVFSEIAREDLFKASNVLLKDKRNATFNTYSVQVNPRLPEAIAEQTTALLDQGEVGADRIIQFLQYYRGNRFVIQTMEKALEHGRVNIRRHDILKIIYPQTFEALRKACGGDWRKTVAAVHGRYRLYDLFERLGNLQDKVKEHASFEAPRVEHYDYERRMAQEADNVFTNYKLAERSVRLTNYFHNYVYPLVFRSIKVSILEMQNTATALEPV
jgi:adenylate cyclase